MQPKYNVTKYNVTSIPRKVRNILWGKVANMLSRTSSTFWNAIRVYLITFFKVGQSL